MEQTLFSELRTLFMTSKDSPCEIRIKIRMRDPIDPGVLRRAVDATMERYPYFCVELQKKDDRYIFSPNRRPVVIADSLQGVELNSEESNYHMIAFCRQDDWIVLDIFHGMTDGAGAYEVLKTFIYYYCSERYGVSMDGERVRLVGDVISEEEWNDPMVCRTDLPAPEQSGQLSDALSLVAAAGLEEDRRHTAYSVVVSESEFMKFNLDHDGSPGTMVALLLSRAIAKMYPDAKDIIRINLCVNQRMALRAPLAHQSLVGGVFLEYKDKMRDWPLDKQATAYRGMVFVQAREEAVLRDVAVAKGLNGMLLSMKSDRERLALSEQLKALTTRAVTAVVSYVGKANYKKAEQYIRDFRAWTAPVGDELLVEISAFGGRFTFEFLQKFSSPVFVKAFLREMEENGIAYELQGVSELDLPGVRLPWLE